jgi:cysteine desulfurase family protein (TIGR01976 family)
MSIDIDVIRQQFPSLSRPAIFFDNPGGTQIAKPVLDRMVAYLRDTNANHAGQFATSIASDAIIDEARQSVADFLNANRAEEIVFGANMTSITFHISRTLARTWHQGDSIVVTRLDHDANITPWVLAAEERGCLVQYVDFNLETGQLNINQLSKALQTNPRLVAVGYSSNALGTVNPVREITAIAHASGALVYVDAVHYAPHGPIDVQDLDCDFLVCSGYKFFGPHVGMLYGKFDLLDQLTTYKVRPAPKDPPGKFQTGTQNFEGIAGMLGALEYLEWLGENYGNTEFAAGSSNRRLRLQQAMAAISAYEIALSHAMLEILEETPGVTVFGPTEMDRLDQRVPTFAFTLEGMPPRQVSAELGKRDIFVWDGNYYALQVTESLGLEESGGMVRVGPVHYNTVEEIQRFGKVLGEIATR